jgi:hypothetical protein
MSDVHLCFNFYSGSRRKMYFYVLICAEVRRQMDIDVLGCSVVIDVLNNLRHKCTSDV